MAGNTSPLAGRDMGVFCLFFFFFFVREDGEEISMLRLDDRTLHVFVGGCLGTGFGKTIKVAKASSYHSPFGPDAAGHIYFISRTFWSFFVCCILSEVC